jgi:hypothetical protein
MKPPKCIKDIQKLTGCMAALSHFISQLGEKGLLFFKLLKAKEKFEWLEEANATFVELKQFLTSPLSLRCPRKAKPYCFTSRQLIGWLVQPLLLSVRKSGMCARSND